MAEIKKWWHGLVAGDLVKELKRIRRSCVSLRDDYIKVVDKLKKTEADLEQETRIFNDRINALQGMDPMVRALSENRHHASQQRICDLESEVIHLRKLLKEANED